MVLKNIDSVILSRTDSIGDMVLTLPMAKALKEKYPSLAIAVLGRPYTKAVVEANPYIDAFIELDDFLQGEVTIGGKKPDAIIHVKPETYVAKRAKELQIPIRIGTSSRLYHWFTCNKLVRLSRKRSNLHEAQLNLKLLKPFGINKIFSFAEIADLYALNRLQPLEDAYKQLLQKDKFNLILHPKSRGNAREWGIENFSKLVQMLDTSRYNIFVSGTENEKEAIQPLMNATGNRVINLAGKMPLAQFLSFISHCDGLVACSTGPLHVAAATGIHAYGLYVPLRPIHAGRWGPIGKNAHTFIANDVCSNCKNKSGDCSCLQTITPEQIKEVIDKSAKAIR